MAGKARPGEGSPSRPGKAAGDGEDGGQAGRCGLKKPTRRRLDIVLNSPPLQLVVVIIVFLQIPLLGSLLMIDFGVIRDPQTAPPPRPPNETRPNEGLMVPPGDSPVKLAERILHTVNIVLLLVFLVEIILRISARGSRIHTDSKQVFDCGVVMLTFVLYVAFTAADMRRAAYGCGLFIVLRLWRIHRIAKNIAENEHRKLEKTLVTHRKAQKDAEEQLKVTHSKMAAMQQEMDVLQQQLKVIHYIGKASPAISSSAYSKVSEDLVTSDEESERYTDCDSQIQTPKILDNVQVEMTSGGRRFYANSSIHTSCSPSPATSFSHLVDEFLMNSEFKDFKELSSLSKAAPTKVSVPDLVEHLQAADAKVKSSEDDLAQGNRSEESDLTKDSALYQHQQQYQPNSPTSEDSPSEVRKDDNGSQEAGSPELTHPPHSPPVGSSSNNSEVTSPTNKPSTSQMSQEGPQKKDGDRQHLIPGMSSGQPEMREKSADAGHDNPGFEPDVSVPEKGSMERASELPNKKHYGSSTYLNEEGIPMTDL